MSEYKELNLENLRYRIFQHIKGRFPSEGLRNEDLPKLWDEVDHLLPLVLDLLAEQIEKDARVGCQVLEFDPWKTPVLHDRREWLLERAERYKALADEQRKLLAP